MTTWRDYVLGFLAWLAIGGLVAGLTGCTHIGTILDAIPTNAVPVTTTTTTTTTTTLPSMVAPPPASLYAYTITRVTADMIYWTGPNLDWPERDGCCGEAHLYRADGRGGKFDHVRRNSKSRDWKNVHGGYGIFGTIGEPEDGEQCELVLVSYDGKQRVSVGKFPWRR
jgi:hypothetical protein